MGIDTVFPLDECFFAKENPITEDEIKKAFSKRVGFLGGYSLGFLGGTSTLDYLHGSKRDLYDTFFQLAGKKSISSLDDDALLEALDKLAYLVPQSGSSGFRLTIV
jgi:hypothetical protein